MTIDLFGNELPAPTAHDTAEAKLDPLKVRVQMKRIFYPPAGKIKNDDDLDAQLNIEKNERWPLALIAIACAAFVLLLGTAIIAGLTFYIWRPLIFK